MSERRPAVAVLAVLAVLLLAGCAGLPLSGPTTAAPADGPVAVASVVDGDTIEVAYDDGTTDRVRLLGVDTPEVGGPTTPAEFEGVPNTSAGRACLRAVAEAASAHVETLLADTEVGLTLDDAADRRDRYGRLLAYVSLPNGTDLNRHLVAAGYARVYDTAFARSAAYYEAEAAAQAAGAGVWRCREPPTPTGGGLALAAVHADAAGNDNHNLNDEYLVFENVAGESIDLSGWTVRDGAGHAYTFPVGVVLPANATVTLHTGSGTDSGADLYWGADGAVWNNGGDVVVVGDADGTEVLRWTY
jgi:micrococcal nuclease